MEYREFYCVVCGAKAIDYSTTRSKKYCSDECAQEQYRRNRGIGTNIKTALCKYNIAIGCPERKCSSCGWNPKVEAKRKEALGHG